MHLKKPEDVVLGFDVLKQDEHHDVLILTKGMVFVARPSPTHIVKLRDDAEYVYLNSTIKCHQPFLLQRRKNNGPQSDYTSGYEIRT